MAAANDIIHQPVRLRILAALNAARPMPIEFSRLKLITEATNGNLGSHLSTLESAGYVRLEKDFAHKRPRTRAFLTGEGRRALEAHLSFLRDIIDAAGG